MGRVLELLTPALVNEQIEGIRNPPDPEVLAEAAAKLPQ
jgi:hypothetical protein